MARIVPERPLLPLPGGSSIPQLSRYDTDLNRSLNFYLQELAMRANASLPRDGSEPIMGDLLVNGDITADSVTATEGNFDTLTLNGVPLYEEGTWTPTVGGATTPGSATYSFQNGVFTRIGRLVTVSFRITLTASTPGTGAPGIFGLPYAPAGGNAEYSGQVGVGGGVGTLPSNFAGWALSAITASGGYLGIRYENALNGSVSPATTAIFGSAFDMRGSITYEAAV